MSEPRTTSANDGLGSVRYQTSPDHDAPYLARVVGKDRRFVFEAEEESLRELEEARLFLAVVRNARSL